MNRAQKLHYLLIGFFAFAAFGIGFSAPQIDHIAAETGSSCSLAASDDWCSTWEVSNWLDAFSDGNNTVHGTVGPADWRVEGQARINGVPTNFQEEWRLTVVAKTWKTAAEANAMFTETFCRGTWSGLECDRNGGDMYKARSDGANAATVSNDFDLSGYVGASNNWRPLYYGQHRYANDDNPGNYKFTTFYPVQWTVSGRFE